MRTPAGSLRGVLGVRQQESFEQPGCSGDTCGQPWS